MIDRGKAANSVAELADAAFDATAEEVLRRARETGTDILIWENNAIARVSPDEFERTRKENDQGSQDK